MNKRKKNSKSIYIYVCIAVFFLYFLTTGMHSQAIPPSLKEIKELYTRGNFSLVLEKSLNILNTREDRLSPLEAAFLHNYIGLAYKKNQNNEMAAEYFKIITLTYPASDYVKTAYIELADIFKDDYFQQEAYLEKVFELFPKTPEAVKAGIELSKGYLQLKNFKKALKVMETIVNLWKKGEENPGLYMLMAVGYSGIKDYLEAIDYLRKAEKKIKPTIDSNPQYIFEAGKILHNNLNFAAAITYLERLFNVYPGYENIPEAVITLAQCYERENKLFLSAVFLIKAIEKNPPKKELYSLFLNLGRVLGRLDKNEFKKIKRNYPLYSDSQKLLILVKNNSLDFEQKRTAAILLSEEFKKADNIEKVVNNYYNFLREQRDPLVEKLFKQNLDNYLYDQDKKEKYLEIFETWVKLKGRKSYLSGENLLKFGKILMKSKLYTNALEIYQHIIKYRLYSNYWPTAREQLVRLYFQLGRREECLPHFEHLDIKKNPGKNEFNYYRLSTFYHLNREKEAKKLLDSGAAQVNEISDIYQYRIYQFKARQLQEENKHKEALDIYREMLLYNQAPREDKGQLLISIADLYYEIRDPESSLSYYRQAKKYNTNMEWVLFRIVAILKQKDKPSEAEKELEKLKQLAPDSFWVRQLEKNPR